MGSIFAPNSLSSLSLGITFLNVQKDPVKVNPILISFNRHHPGAGGGRLQAVRPHRRGAQRLVGVRPAGGRRPRRRRRLHRARRPGRGRGRHFGRHPAGTGGGVGADIIRPRSR